MALASSDLLSLCCSRSWAVQRMRRNYFPQAASTPLSRIRASNWPCRLVSLWDLWVLCPSIWRQGLTNLDDPFPNSIPFTCMDIRSPLSAVLVIRRTTFRTPSSVTSWTWVNPVIISQSGSSLTTLVLGYSTATLLGTWTRSLSVLNS